MTDTHSPRPRSDVRTPVGNGANRRRGVAVVTGASAGVGRATVRALAADGWDVGLIAREPNALQQTRRELERLGARALDIPCDVADDEGIDHAAARVEEELGPIDVWINNAMTSVFSPVREMTAREYRRVTEVTYLGCVHGTLAALRRMLPRDRGIIVQVGSALAYRGIPLQSAYCAAKHAIQGFCDSLRSELLHDGSRVRVTMVQLPAINTPQFAWVKSRLPHRAQPVPPIFQPEVAAEAIHYATHHPRRDFWVGRSAIAIILAQKVVPGLLDRYLARTCYSGQQTSERAVPGRPDNLFEPVSGDWGAHGRFDERASYYAPAVKLSEHRGASAAVLALGLGAVMAGVALASRGSRA